MLTSAELQANYFYFCLLWAYNSELGLTNFGDFSNQCILAYDENGELYISEWNRSDTAPTNLQMMSAFSPGDEDKVKNCYLLQGSTPLQFFDYSDLSGVLSDNDGLAFGTCVFIRDTAPGLYIKKEDSSWVGLTSTTPSIKAKGLLSLTKENLKRVAGPLTPKRKGSDSSIDTLDDIEFSDHKMK